MTENNRNKFMAEALKLACDNVTQNGGGPFGAVVVKNNEIIASGYNQVTATNDPTAHAEVVAIRNACKQLGTFQLTDCELYTSCEPCPMCLGAIYWARPAKVYYMNTQDEAASIGFDDRFIYEELALTMQARKYPLERIVLEDSLAAFNLWEQKQDKVEY